MEGTLLAGALKEPQATCNLGGTLLAGALKEPKAACGLILGTGTNLCFIDKVSRIAKLQKPKPFHRLRRFRVWV
ncbi:hypothetical protein T484DRAFT_1797199 [Baffinella frigidus]|nr:hypothetical protein T484DRAFT_1797199 [Cryptophyta sp. CCMP2293]